MDENKLIDQSALAKELSEKIEYDFIDQFLVKPLDPVKVVKEFSKPVSDKPAEKDENGIEAVDYDKVETETREVESDFRRGVVLKVPQSFRAQQNDGKANYLSKISVGDVVLFKDHAGIYFDLLKDSKLIRYYDIVAIVK